MAKKSKKIEMLKHHDKRKKIPTKEFESVMREKESDVKHLTYERRNKDVDPQLFWRGKDEHVWNDLIVPAPPLYIQEKIHPKAILDGLSQYTNKDNDLDSDEGDPIGNLFADFNGIDKNASATDFYQHDQTWSNRLIIGDSLSVMASLAELEDVRGKVQCIYFDPPYGIKFNSNFQWSTTSKTVTDGKTSHLPREPEQVCAFRDTWRDGIHSYLTYIRDRLTVAWDLLTESGSIFVQISDENVHRVRTLLDEVFGDHNFVNQINCRTNSGTTREKSLKRTCDYILWYGKNKSELKFRRFLVPREPDYKIFSNVESDNGKVRKLTATEKKEGPILEKGERLFTTQPLHSKSSGENSDRKLYGKFWGIPNNRSWRYKMEGFTRLFKANRIQQEDKVLRSRNCLNDFPFSEIAETWTDTGPEQNKSYVVQTSEKIIARCIQLATDPGDLVLDPTCGSGTTAYVAEKLGRRWITIDTSRVAIALARIRLMGAKFPYYLLADSEEGKLKIAEITGKTPVDSKTHDDIRLGFVYKMIKQITLNSISDNIEIDAIWDKMQPKIQNSIKELNKSLKGHKNDFEIENGGRSGKKLKFNDSGTIEVETGEHFPINEFMEWEIPFEAPSHWPETAKSALEEYWRVKLVQQKAINISIEQNAEYAFLYNDPFINNSKIRVPGPFTVESLSPIKALTVDSDENLVEEAIDKNSDNQNYEFSNYVEMILENLKVSGVKQIHKDDKIDFVSLQPWPGKYVCAVGNYMEGKNEKRAGIFIGPEFGTVNRPDLVGASREALEIKVDVLISCAFNYDAHSTEFNNMGPIPILKARMNPELHMARDLAESTGGNLFVVFGEPDISVTEVGDNQIQVQIFGVDVFKPQIGQVESDELDGIALWMIDTDYNEESFFARHAYFLGTNNPYKSLRQTLKTEINKEAWESVNSYISRPFLKPSTGRIAVKVINRFGDEVMKVYSI